MSITGKIRFVHAVISTLQESIIVVTRAAAGPIPKDRASFHFWRWADSLCHIGRVDLRVEGMEHIDPARSWIFMSNHRSYWDIPAVAVALKPVPLRMVAKRELFNVPLWGSAMLKLGILPIDRSNRGAAIRSLALAETSLQDGLSVWIAPEGGRSRDSTVGPLKKGGFMVALSTRMPIVPVGIAGSERIAPVDKFEVHPGGIVAVVVGEPIDVTRFADCDDGRDRLIEEVRAAMLRLVARAELMVNEG